MTLALLDHLLNHLWQSTLFAAAVALLTLTLSRNAARVRFGLWFAASLKFLLPFSLLAALGARLSHLVPVALLAPPHLIQPALRLSAPAQLLPVVPGPAVDLLPWLVALWALGFGLVMAVRLIHGDRLRHVLDGARDLDLPVPTPVKTSASLLEPGLIGILRPVVLLPSGLLPHLSRPERDAILAHEFSHFRRRDNLMAAIHMLVESLFWFWPPVWLIGSRLLAERERACDESVLALGHDREVYAQGILKACKFCVHSPLACAAGVSGADLGRRVSLIMTGETAQRLGAPKRLLLAAVAILALGLPVLAGLFASPLAGAVHRRMVAVQAQMETALAQNVTAVTEQMSAPAPRIEVRRLARLKVIVPVAVGPEPATDPAPEPQPVAVTQVSFTDLDSAVASPVAPEDDHPTGDGVLVGVACRTPRPLPDGRPGPKLCMHNRYWALLRAAGLDLSADGTSTVKPHRS